MEARNGTRRSFALLEVQIELLSLPGGTTVPLHEATLEWMKWKNGQPAGYHLPSEMPYWTSCGFTYLCSKYPKDWQPEVFSF